jgi:hypothetical protein
MTRAGAVSNRVRVRLGFVVLAAALLVLGACSRAADVAVPTSCSGATNQKIGALIAQRYDGEVDNVMVCGTTFASSRPQRAGPHGGHQLLPLRIPLPDGSSALVEVVTNDNLDGVVTAPRGAHVAAYGQYYLTTARQRPFVAGIHDTHCATHRGADNGWIVVNTNRYPSHGC